MYIELPSIENQRAGVLMDGRALVQLLGKPSSCNTFDDYALVFLRSVTSHVKRVDVMFDTYIKQSFT